VDGVKHCDGAVEHAQGSLDFSVKSTWPGVSMMLMRMSRQVQVVAAEVMVMPRSCSCSIQSMMRCLRGPRRCGASFPYKQDALRRRGLPASMWAMMPMFGNVLMGLFWARLLYSFWALKIQLLAAGS